MRLLQQGKKNVQYDHYEACNKRTFIIYLLEITFSQKKKKLVVAMKFSNVRSSKSIYVVHTVYNFILTTFKMLKYSVKTVLYK